MQYYITYNGKGRKNIRFQKNVYKSLLCVVFKLKKIKKYEKKPLKNKSDLFEFQKGQIRDIICVYVNQVNVSVNYFSFQMDFT